MANAKRTFFCGPRRAIADARLSALDHRVLAAVALHDGMSLEKRKGGGCYATYRTLSAEVGCDYTNFSKAISRLLRWSYLVREPQLLDKRKFTLRVVYSGRDSWQNDQQSTGEIVGDMTNDNAEIVGLEANETPEIVGRKNSETRRKLPKTASHYTSLREELDFVETSEIDSAKLRAPHFEDSSQDDFSNRMAVIFGGNGFGNDQASNPADSDQLAWQGDYEAGDSDDDCDPSLALTDVQKIRVTLARYERQLKADPGKLDLQSNQASLYTLHVGMLEKDTQAANWALRLYEQTWEVINNLQRRDTGGARSIGNVVGR